MPRSVITGQLPGQAPTRPRPTADVPGWIPVASSNVAAVRYLRPEVFDVAAPVLQVRFKDGSAYTYWNISEGEWDDFFAAGSKGRFVWSNLRGFRRGASLKPYRKGLVYG